MQATVKLSDKIHLGIPGTLVKPAVDQKVKLPELKITGPRRKFLQGWIYIYFESQRIEMMHPKSIVSRMSVVVRQRFNASVRSLLWDLRRVSRWEGIWFRSNIVHTWIVCGRVGPVPRSFLRRKPIGQRVQYPVRANVLVVELFCGIFLILLVE